MLVSKQNLGPQHGWEAPSTNSIVSGRGSKARLGRIFLHMRQCHQIALTLVIHEIIFQRCM